MTSIDPNDDQTMWTIQEYTSSATNKWGTRIAKLMAPPPATPTSSSPGTVPGGSTSTTTTITGTSTAGSGFFDPGPGFANRIGATVTGGVTVNSVTYVDPSHVTLDLDTAAATPGTQGVTITNPDGQAETGRGVLTITAAPKALTVSKVRHGFWHGHLFPCGYRLRRHLHSQTTRQAAP